MVGTGVLVGIGVDVSVGVSVGVGVSLATAWIAAPCPASLVLVGASAAAVCWLICNRSMIAVMVKSGVEVTTITIGVGETK
ncbi:MAG: hypothetical protein FJ010_04590 [Chloroflexi bacterium]|nr:hypothetical protein [Chloroflexota bacterium]